MSQPNTTIKRNGWPVRFSLRSALLSMFMAAVLLGGWRVYLLPFQRQSAAAEALTDAGAAIDTKTGGSKWLRLGLRDEKFQEPTHLNLESAEFRDDLLPHILALRRLHSLVVSGEGFAFEHLHKLRALPQLRFLILDSTSVTEEETAAFAEQHPDVRIHLSQARAIAELRSGGNRVNDQLIRLTGLARTRAGGALAAVVTPVAPGRNMVRIGARAAPTFPAAAWAPTTGAQSGSPPAAAPPTFLAKFGLHHFELADNATISYASGRSPTTFGAAAAPLKHLTTLTRLEVHKAKFTDDDVAQLPSLPRLSDLHLNVGFSQNELSDAGLSQLAMRMPQLAQLDMSRSRISDAGMRFAAKLPNLAALQVRKTRVGDEGLAHLVRMKKLKTIDLHETRVSDAGMAHLAELSQLEELILCHTAVTDAGMRHVARLPNLKILDLRETSIGDEGLKHLARLTTLEVLVLHATNVSDAGLAHLAHMPRLHTLYLAHTAVTDDSVEHLRSLKSLKWLDLSFTKFSLQATRELEKHLPLNPIVR